MMFYVVLFLVPWPVCAMASVTCWRHGWCHPESSAIQDEPAYKCTRKNVYKNVTDQTLKVSLSPFLLGPSKCRKSSVLRQAEMHNPARHNATDVPGTDRNKWNYAERFFPWRLWQLCLFACGFLQAHPFWLLEPHELNNEFTRSVREVSSESLV